MLFQKMSGKRTTTSMVSPSAPIQLWSWGQNTNGQLGKDDTISRSSPAQVGALATWSQIAGGEAHSLARKTDGTLWSWGNNYNPGQLGLGDTIRRSSPVQVGTLATWTSVACGNTHTLAIKTDGTLWAWGENGNYQLGLGSYADKSSPVQVGTLVTWSQVAGGNGHSLAVKTDSTLWSWGKNTTGQLGQANIAYRSVPTQVGTLATWASVAGGAAHTLALKTDGTLWSWGNNYNPGQLGLGDTIRRSSPVQVGTLATWSSVAGGGLHSLARKTDGTLWAWGSGNNGKLGLSDSGNEPRSSPVQVGTLTTWSTVSAGQEGSYAIQTNGTLWAEMVSGTILA